MINIPIWVFTIMCIFDFLSLAIVVLGIFSLLLSSRWEDLKELEKIEDEQVESTTKDL